MQGIAPTLLVGRVAAGHARPDDSWQGSIMSSLHFGTRLGGWRSQQGSDELEGQLEGGDEYAVAAASTAYSDDGVTHQDHCKTQSEKLDNTAVGIAPRD